MVVQFKDAYEERLFKSNQKVLECYELLDPEAEDYVEKLEALAKIQKEIAADFKAYGEIEVEEANEKLEKEKLDHEKKSNKISQALQAAGLLLSGVTFAVSQGMRHKHFKIANKYEQDNAYLTTSDKHAVNDALKEEQPSKAPWQFWK